MPSKRKGSLLLVLTITFFFFLMKWVEWKETCSKRAGEATLPFGAIGLTRLLISVYRFALLGFSAVVK